MSEKSSPSSSTMYGMNEMKSLNTLISLQHYHSYADFNIVTRVIIKY